MNKYIAYGELFLDTMRFSSLLKSFYLETIAKTDFTTKLTVRKFGL